MVESIVKLFAGIVALFAERGLDSLIGKYLAMATIAFEKAATAQALKEFRDQREALSTGLAAKYDDWNEWRKKANGGS